MGICSIVLADDHVLIRKGLIKILEGEPGFIVSGEVSDGLELLSYLKKNSPDLVLLDISMPNLRGIEAIAEAKKLCPNVKIIILTMHSSKDFLCSSRRAGADGYLLKEDSDTELINAISTCLKGNFYLSPFFVKMFPGKSVDKICQKQLRNSNELTTREKQVITMVAEGKKSKDIAELLSISIRTVEHHRANIMKKSKIANTAELIKYALQKGYISS